MKASSESGLCATLISRALLAELLIGAESLSRNPQRIQFAITSVRTMRFLVHAGWDALKRLLTSLSSLRRKGTAPARRPPPVASFLSSLPDMRFLLRTARPPQPPPPTYFG